MNRCRRYPLDFGLSDRDRERYQRQILIPGWGDEGQRKIKEVTVGVAGVGGLGSALLTYLAVTGFGRIVLADRDRVEMGNLNRQILHWENNVGMAKTVSAVEKLRQLNSDVEYVVHDTEIRSENVERIFEGVDLLMDGMDNFPGRYLLNDLAVKRRIPFFHGAVWGLEGRASTIVPGRTPCFRCIYPEAEPQETVPVAGVTPALIAVLQVTEALKFVLGMGERLEGKLLLYDGENLEFTQLSVRRDPDCPVCGDLT
jgi:adenylyltransferase/sulfurtransferase